MGSLRHGPRPWVSIAASAVFGTDLSTPAGRGFWHCPARGMRILERHGHAKAAPGVPPGCDATIARWPSVNFAHPAPSPGRLRAVASGIAVRVFFRGLRPAGPFAQGAEGAAA